ncbi:hypothetical protein EGI26_12270 [Lacihabitans sp. CCS-44]|nr:hypothetical protein [Lacihabitans sp. CCS-44]
MSNGTFFLLGIDKLTKNYFQAIFELDWTTCCISLNSHDSFKLFGSIQCTISLNASIRFSR